MMRKIIKISLILALTFNIAGCLESSFELASDSRLPKWFILSEGMKRSDIKVTMDYYTGKPVIFKMYHKDRFFSLHKVKGSTRGIYPLKLKNPPAGYPEHYPMYQVITVGEQTEVIEHRKMEPVFYITDDRKILKEFKVIK